MPAVVLPTRITNHSATCIDHIFVKIPKKQRNTKITSGVLYSDISDHLPTFLHINNSNISFNSRPMVRIFSETNYEKFKNKVEDIDWNDVFLPQQNWFDRFIAIMKRLYNECFPFKRLSRKRAKDKVWVTKGLKTSIIKKNQLYKKSIRTNTPDVHSRYRTYANRLTKLLKVAETEYYQGILYQHGNSSTNLWKHFGKCLNPKNTIKGLLSTN